MMTGSRPSWVVDVHSTDLHGELAVRHFGDLHVWLPNTMNRLPAPVFLSSSSPIARVWVHSRSQNREFAIPLDLFGHMGVEGEATDDERVVAHSLYRLLCRLFYLLRSDRAVFRAERYSHPLGLAVLRVLSDGLDPFPACGSSRSNLIR